LPSGEKLPEDASHFKSVTQVIFFVATLSKAMFMYPPLASEVSNLSLIFGRKRRGQIANCALVRSQVDGLAGGYVDAVNICIRKGRIYAAGIDKLYRLSSRLQAAAFQE
jgi:hypothetical protein